MAVGGLILLPQIAERRATYACQCGATVTLDPTEPLPEGWATTTVASWGEHINWRAKAYRPDYLCPRHAGEPLAPPSLPSVNFCRECLEVEVPPMRRYCSAHCENAVLKRERAEARAAQRGRLR